MSSRLFITATLFTAQMVAMSGVDMWTEFSPRMEPGPYLSSMCCIYLTVYVKGVLLRCICMYVFLYIIS